MTTLHRQHDLAIERLEKIERQAREALIEIAKILSGDSQYATTEALIQARVQLEMVQFQAQLGLSLDYEIGEAVSFFADIERAFQKAREEAA